MKQEKGTITAENFPKFKRAYNKAVKENASEFQFEGQSVLTAYAKYVVQYAEGLKKEGFDKREYPIV